MEDTFAHSFFMRNISAADVVRRLLDVVYAEPCPYDSAEDFSRAHHDDIPSLTLDEIDAERILARFRWALTICQREDPPRWLLERLAKLDQAADERRQRQRASR